MLYKILLAFIATCFASQTFAFELPFDDPPSVTSSSDSIIAEWDIGNNSETATTVAAINVATGISATEIEATGVSLLTYNSPDFEGIYIARDWSTSLTNDMSKFYTWEANDISTDYGWELENLSMSLSRGELGARKWDIFINDTYVDTFDLTAENYVVDDPEFWDVDLTGVAISENYEFRLYGYAATGNSYDGLNNYEKIATNVSLTANRFDAVPEPATVGLLGLSAFMIYGLRKFFS